jgi:hypothetical protein
MLMNTHLKSQYAAFLSMTDGWPIEKATGRGATRRGRKTDVDGLSLANHVMPPRPFKEPFN